MGFNLVLLLLGVGLSYAHALPDDLKELKKSYKNLVGLQRRLARTKKQALCLKSMREKILGHQRNGAEFLTHRADRLKNIYASANQHARKDTQMPEVLQNDLGLSMPEQLAQDSHRIIQYEEMENILVELEELTKRQLEGLQLSEKDRWQFQQDQMRQAQQATSFDPDFWGNSENSDNGNRATKKRVQDTGKAKASRTSGTTRKRVSNRDSRPSEDYSIQESLSLNRKNGKSK